MDKQFNYNISKVAESRTILTKEQNNIFELF